MLSHMTLRQCLTLSQSFCFFTNWIISVFCLQFNTSLQFHCLLQFALKPISKLFFSPISYFTLRFWNFYSVFMSSLFFLCVYHGDCVHVFWFGCLWVCLFLYLLISLFICVSVLPAWTYVLRAHAWSQRKPEEGVRCPNKRLLTTCGC